jgi:transposase-like protein
LKAAGVSGNEIARRVGVASSTVRLTLKRLAVAGLSWPLPAELTDTALEAPESAPAQRRLHDIALSTAENAALQFVRSWPRVEILN